MGVVSCLPLSVLQQCARGENKQPVLTVTGPYTTCLTEAGFPIVWCWNIPQGGPGTLKTHGFGLMPAFLLRILWTRARSSLRSPQSQDLASRRCWTVSFSHLYLQTLSPQIYKVLSSFSSNDYCMSALWKCTWTPAHGHSFLFQASEWGRAWLAALTLKFLLVSIHLKLQPSSRGQRGMTHFFQVSKWSQD